MANMKFLLILSVFLTGCTGNMAAGLISGGLLGGGIGGMTGGCKGALIGSGAGLLAGGLIGAILDEQDRKVMKQSSPRTVDRMDRDEPLTINDIIKLSQSGVSDDTIIQYLYEQKTNYNLTQAQTRRLQDAGVSQKVINTMVKIEK